MLDFRVRLSGLVVSKNEQTVLDKGIVAGMQEALCVDGDVRESRSLKQ